MDPTKPILDLYGQSFYSVRERQEPKPQNYKSSNVSAYQNYNQQNQNQQQNTQSKYKSNTNTGGGNAGGRRNYNEPSYAQLQDKYQELYQAYKDKSSKLAQHETDTDHLRAENVRLRNEIDRLTSKNQQLNSNLLAKNQELEDAYRRLQEEMRAGGSRVGRVQAHAGNQAAIVKLEDGLKEAIHSNFQILRESALSELKHYMQ